MATRILITDAQGVSITCLDGYHGARHAAEWAMSTLLTLASGGIDAIAFELLPVAGGDHFRCDMLEKIGRIRIEFHERPDGMREIVSMARFPDLPGGAAAHGVGRGLSKASAAATAEAVHCAFRLLHAPADVHGDRQAVRVPRGRENVPAGEPRTIAEIRARRRALQADGRMTASVNT